MASGRAAAALFWAAAHAVAPDRIPARSGPAVVAPPGPMAWERALEDERAKAALASLTPSQRSLARAVFEAMIRSLSPLAR